MSSIDKIKLYQDELAQLDALVKDHRQDAFLGYVVTGFLETVKGGSSAFISGASVIGGKAAEPVAQGYNMAQSIVGVRQAFDQGDVSGAFSHFLTGLCEASERKEIGVFNSLLQAYQGDQSLVDKMADITKSLLGYAGKEVAEASLDVTQNLKDALDGMGRMGQFNEATGEFEAMVESRRRQLLQMIEEEQATAAGQGGGRFSAQLENIFRLTEDLRSNVSV